MEAADRPIDASYPPAGFAVPDFVSEDGRYRVRFARDASDLRAIQELRFRVFNLELGEGLAESHATGLDRDVFDTQCHHLLVEDGASREAVGTYRMQSAAMAAAGVGFYSAQEYDFAAWPAEILERAVEAGRACIAAAHRHRKVLLLLWRGLGHYALHHHSRYIFGCCSLTSQDPAEGARTLEYLRRRGHVRDDLPLPARPLFHCRPRSGDEQGWEGVQLPRLFRTYLRYGAKICGEPALDRDFGTIDFLALIDLSQLDPLAILRQFEVDLRETR